MQQTIQQWLSEGAEVQQGLRLLSLYQPNKSLERLVRAKPDRYRELLTQRLCALAGVSDQPAPPPPKREYPKFRELWPFLSESSCPHELKILATDKITAFRGYAQAHDELYGCTSTKQCFEVAERAVMAYLENHTIFREFQYYKQHNTPLGEHPIFKASAEIDQIKKMSILSLVKRQQQLEQNIWRVENEIRKGTKPHLDIERRQRLERTKEKLIIVNKYIKEHE